MKFNRFSAAVASLALLAIASAAVAFPKPSVYPVSWQYKFQYSAPKRIAVLTPGSTVARGYWYMTYTITNKDIEDSSIRFMPVFEMLARDGTVVRADKDVPGVVYEEIRKREGRKSLEGPDKLRGVIRLGDDQARDGIVAWPEPGPRMGTFTLFFGGLSGETIYIGKDGKELDMADWTKLTDDQKKSLTTLRKTLAVTYTIPGDELYPGEDSVNFVGQEWLMR